MISLENNSEGLGHACGCWVYSRGPDITILYVAEFISGLQSRTGFGFEQVNVCGIQ